ncbi:hypothetical protein MAR_036863 [Mya arenaria]|uniref:KY-like immunoglobulin-like domain-containing protein n=2 Tax=Mya arenaria TaxID=6604 RepID=A0ABY7FQQ0_MYAAR|nr:hypothetical protein MAR_036863 [Mya arenaria]
MIFGKGKDLNYVPGGTYFDMIPQASWNSFRCNNVWHLVYTELAIATVHGFHRGGEVLLEEDGDKKFYQSVATRGHTKAEFNDFWFCTNPYILAIHALPEDKKLQYLSADQAFDEEKFEQCAYLQPGFFMADLTLLTEDRWVLQSKRGRCTITVGCEETILKGLQFKYKLAFILESGELTEENITAMPRMVVYAPGMDEVTFTISLPVKGEYKFSTFVTSSEMERYVECFVFRIYCDEPDMHCRSIPKVVEEIGVGYTHVAKEFGLKNPSKATPTINVQNGTSKRTLQIADDKIDELEFSSEFVGTDVEIGYSEVKVDHQKGTLEVKAGLKREGECVLVIKGRDKLKRERFKPILNYIVSSYDNDEDDHEKLVRKNKKEVRKKSKSACKQKEVTTLLDRLRQIEKEVEYLNDTNMSKSYKKKADA